jgi:hypothetical protein
MVACVLKKVSYAQLWGVEDQVPEPKGVQSPAVRGISPTNFSPWGFNTKKQKGTSLREELQQSETKFR